MQLRVNKTRVLFYKHESEKEYSISCAEPKLGLSHVVKAVALGAAFLFGQVGNSQAQSFNCRYAATADEVLICQDSDLGTLDERMSSLFFRLKNRLHGYDKIKLQDDQRYYISKRLACGRDAECITRVYNNWIGNLEGMDENE